MGSIILSYKQLLEGKAGGDVIYKHKAIGSSDFSNEWCDFLAQICLKIMKQHEQSEDTQKKIRNTTNLRIL